MKRTANLSRDRLLLSRQLLEQALQPGQYLFGLLLFERELENTRRGELASGFSGNKARQAFGIDEALSVKRMLTASRRRSICATPIRCDSSFKIAWSSRLRTGGGGVP